MDHSRINNTWPLAREGIPFIIAGCVLTGLLWCGGISWGAVPAGLLTLFTLFFFRDPERSPDPDPGAVLTPADGTVLEVRKVDEPDSPLDGPAWKISIFMSVFNVHVNRVPLSGTIAEIVYHPGKYFSAHLDKASKYNESNRITLRTDEGRTIVFIQIAGLIARRIACWVQVGDRVSRGQRFGLIRFGSRLEVFLPVEGNPKAQPGQRVKAGETVIGYLA